MIQVACRTRFLVLASLWLGLLTWFNGSPFASLQAQEPEAIDPLVRLSNQARTKIVKLFGAGGIAGLEAYQTGVLITPEGHILTAWSHVLDIDSVVAFLDDGQRLEASLVGYDPRTEIAILKVDLTNAPCFPLEEMAEEPQPGDFVLALTNLYGVATGNEAVSVQHGTVTAIRSLEGDRIGGRLPYTGPVLVTDAITSNPGAAGGALVDAEGRLLGLIGKDLKAQEADIWLNYALPISELRRSIDDILSGKLVVDFSDDGRPLPSEPMTFELLGLELVPDVVGRTPPFIERVVRAGAAERAGLQPDDLLLFVNDRLVASRRQVEEALRRVHRDDLLSITVQRGRETLTVELEAR